MPFAIGRSATSRLVLRVGVFTRFSRSVGLQAAAAIPRIQTPSLRIRKAPAFRGFASAGQPTTATTTRGTKSAAKKKPTKKTAKKPAEGKKAASKPKSQPKPRPAKKPTPEQKAKEKARKEIRALKEAALFHEPKKLPASAYVVYMVRRFKNGAVQDFQDMKNIGQEFKALPEYEVKELESLALQNAAENKAIYKKWVESYSPEQIRAANRARRRLKKKYNIPASIKTIVRIRDERPTRRPLAPYMLYLKSRWASGDFAGVDPREASRRIGAAWRGLTDAERQPYVDQWRSARP
ncbi:hypothetical protein F5Y17DRAFT_413866 [Xylariaceae sp. FL0594]|nr:hypothetical protein F5Y17DRAFT_413866 [Xylariaceae sp. FL0594]